MRIVGHARAPRQRLLAMHALVVVAHAANATARPVMRWCAAGRSLGTKVGGSQQLCALRLRGAQMVSPVDGVPTAEEPMESPMQGAAGGGDEAARYGAPGGTCGCGRG